MTNKFTETHSHSDFSSLRLIDSINKVDDLIQSAYDKGLMGIALTDHECLSGHIKALNKYKELKKLNPETEFKVLLGNEIYLCDTRDKGQKYYHFILIAKDLEGHRQLREISSRAWLNSYRDRRLERVVTLKTDIEEIIGESKGHLIAQTACLGSEFSQLLLAHLSAPTQQTKLNIHEFVTWCLKVFGEDFYIEIQSGTSTEQVDYNKMAVVIAKAYGIKWVASNDVHFIEEKDRVIHKAFLNSKQEEREVDDFYMFTYMKTGKETSELLFVDPVDAVQAIENTMDIYTKCEVIDLSQPTIVPHRFIENTNVQHIFKKWYPEYEFLNNFAMSQYDQDQWFLQEVEKGFLEKGEEFSDVNIGRINLEMKELWLISEKLGQRLSAYYNLVQQCIDIMWDDNLGNSLVGVARGSVTGFYTCYLMSITQMNPIKWDLPHWRHIVSERPELPKQLGIQRELR